MANGANGIDPEATSFLPAPAISPPVLPQPLEALLGLMGGQAPPGLAEGGAQNGQRQEKAPGLHPAAHSLIQAMLGDMGHGRVPSSLALHGHTQALYKDFPYLMMGLSPLLSDWQSAAVNHAWNTDGRQDTETARLAAAARVIQYLFENAGSG